MSNNTYKAFTLGKLDHLKLMYNKTIDELIKDEFEGFSGIFILAKLKNFILKFMPEYMNFLVDRAEKVEPFNPEIFGFNIEYEKYQKEMGLKRWVLEDKCIEIISYLDTNRFDDSDFYIINCFDPTEKIKTIKTRIYYGKIPSYSFAFQLFKNLGIEIK